MAKQLHGRRHVPVLPSLFALKRDMRRLGAFSAVKHGILHGGRTDVHCWKYCMAFDYKYCPHAYIMDIVLNDD